MLNDDLFNSIYQKSNKTMSPKNTELTQFLDD